MWTGRTEIHLRPDLKCGSRAETIFMKLTVTRYVVVDMPCTEMYLNGTRFVETTDKIYYKPLIKIQFPLVRGGIFCTGFHPNRSGRKRK